MKKSIEVYLNLFNLLLKALMLVASAAPGPTGSTFL